MLTLDQFLHRKKWTLKAAHWAYSDIFCICILGTCIRHVQNGLSESEKWFCLKCEKVIIFSDFIYGKCPRIKINPTFLMKVESSYCLSWLVSYKYKVVVWSIFGNTILKKVINKSMSKLALKVMRDRGGPDLSFETLRPKFDLILWSGSWAKVTNFIKIKGDH